VRLKEAEILTAKLTALLSDIGNRQRTSADPSPRIFILCGHRWTLADAKPAVFKTVCGALRIQGSTELGSEWRSRARPLRVWGGGMVYVCVGERNGSDNLLLSFAAPNHLSNRSLRPIELIQAGSKVLSNRPGSELGSGHSEVSRLIARPSTPTLRVVLGDQTVVRVTSGHDFITQEHERRSARLLAEGFELPALQGRR
jgi:hypothetical protein